MAMGAWPACFVRGGGSGFVVAATERPSLPVVGNSGRALLAFRLVCRLCVRQEARGFRAPADSEGLSESGGSHTLGRATRSVGPTDYAFAAQFQGADRFSGRRGPRSLTRWHPAHGKPANRGNSRRSLRPAGWAQT